MDYPIIFRGAILETNNTPLVVDEVTFKGPLDVGQVLVRIYFSGICGKQIEEIKGSAGIDPFLPHFLGHEGSGIVVDIGPGVRKVKEGDYVVLHWMKGSGINANTPIYERQGKRVNAGWVTTFNEYGVISEDRVTPIPTDSDMETACLLGCAVTTGVGVVLNEAKVRPGESTAVVGCGGVGLNAIQAAALARAFPIIAIDTRASNLDLAKELGATHTVLARRWDVISEIIEITNGLGVKYVIAATGDPKGIEIAVNSSSEGGTVFFVGVPPADSTITIEPLKIHKLRKLVGSYGGGTFPDIHIPAYLNLHRKGNLDLKKLITNIVSLDRINDGIEMLLSGSPGRFVVRMVQEYD